MNLDWYRSHFGSRYKAGRCDPRSPFFVGSNPEEVIFNCDWQKLAAPWSSQAVPHHSTSQALGCLTSEVGRDLVFSTRYGRQRYGCFSPRYVQLKVQAKVVVLLCVHKQRFCHTNFLNRQKPKDFNPGKEVTEVLKLRHKSHREVLNPKPESHEGS